MDITRDTSEVSDPTLAILEQNDYLPFGTRIDPVYYLYAESALGTALLIAPNYNNVYFGQNPNQTYHAFRHIDELELSRTQVKMAVLDDI